VNRAEAWPARATFALFITTFGWATAPIFIRLCANEFDPIMQTFTRYCSGSALLAGICLIRWRSEFILLLLQPWRLAGISALNIAMQCIWTVGCYGTTATEAQLIIKLNIVFVILFAYVLFREERAVIRNPRFLAGTTISLVGLVLVLMKDEASIVPVLDSSSILLLIMSVCWAAYVVWGKHLAWKMHPVPMFGVLSIQTAIGLGALALFFGDFAKTASISPQIWGIAVVSGFISIGLAHPAFQYAQRELGSAFCTSVNLINPLFTFLFSLVLLPGESINQTQWLGAIALLAGMGFVIRAAQRNNPKDTEIAVSE